MERQRITIAVLALGGQGGGVLADWILAAAYAQGWHTQGTSVPGVAQRTGSTVYYIELFPGGTAAAPVLAMMPVPGDVDVVIASELMEAGRAILRGFVTAERTTLVASTHRIYAISEKSAMGDGLAASGRIVEAAGQRARRFIGFDMDAAAAAAGSVISSVMLGALAASGALPFARGVYEDAIRGSGIAVDANLRGFAAGWEAAEGGLAMPLQPETGVPVPTTAAGRALAARVAAELPPPARALATEGVRRLMDYQDAAYAGLYLERLQAVFAVDDDGELTAETARHLALRMSYEDTIRVADLKTRASRVARVRSEVRASDGQVLGITEFMHPRLQEVCETLPEALGRYVLGSPALRRRLQPLFAKGRFVETTRLHWFVVLYVLAGLRRWRRGTLRFREETARIEAWLALVIDTARHDPAAARELVACQQLIKGYGETFERGLHNYETIAASYARVRARSDAAAIIRQLREAALADEDGEALSTLTRPLTGPAWTDTGQSTGGQARSVIG